MALVPVAFAGDPMVQVLSMGAILILFAGLQSRLWPWRTEFANWSDFLSSPRYAVSHAVGMRCRGSMP